MRVVCAAVAVLFLGSCGGDSSNGSSSTPAPAPAPSPTPSPTPTPSPSPTPTGVTPFDQLSGAVTLQSLNSGFRTDFSPPVEVGINAFGEGARYQYNATTRAIAQDNGPQSLSFTSADIDTSAPANTVRYAKANGEQLLLIRPVINAAGLQWTRFIDTIVNTPPNTTRTIAVTGVPTPTADIPTSGTVTFSRTLVIGDAYTSSPSINGPVTAYSLLPSTLTVSINYSTQRITFSLALSGVPTAGGAVVSLGTIAGTTDFAGSTTGITATSSNYPQTAELQIGAALFGTRGAEAGGIVVYRASSTDRRNVLNLIARFAAAN